MAYTASQVAAAYLAVEEANPPGGNSGAYVTSIVGQLNAVPLTLTPAGYVSQLVFAAQETTIPALTAYDFFYGAIPTNAGLAFLATGAGPGSATSLEAAGFSLINVYVNFGVTFAMPPAANNFATTYATAAMSDTAFVNAVYSQIFGFTPSLQAQNVLVSAIAPYGAWAVSIGAATAATADLAGRGAVAGVMLYLAEQQTTQMGTAAVNFLTQDGLAAFFGTTFTGFNQPPTIELIQGYGAPAVSNFTLTPGQDTFVGAVGANATFNAPLVSNNTGSGAIATLSDGDSLTASGPNNVLNANFSGTPSPEQPASVNIVGIQTWNIDQGLGNSNIVITGDAAGGGAPIISGLLTLNFHDDETNGSLFIGDNQSPVYEPNGANGFTITVSDAVGTGFNGVDVDIAASAFTGKDTIFVNVNVVGGFPEQNGSFVIPPPILGEANDPDNYNPNWDGYGADAFAISAGASSSSLTTLNGVTLPVSGAVGFQNWVIASTGAKAVGSLNILALGNEGSWNASTLTMTDDGSNTMLFGSFISDSLVTDWSHLATINFSGTSGFVTLTGAEVLAVGSAFSGGFFGLMTADTSSLVSITGGTGNSFYDLSSLTLTAAHAATLLQGGTGTKGNSEIAFNNSVIASVSTTNPLGLSVNISNIQILDDTGNQVSTTGSGSAYSNGGAGSTQGGTINMADFAGTSSATLPTGLQGLNQAYALISEPNPAPTLVPYGLPYTSTALVVNDGPGGTSNDVVPAGYQLLQFLDADGSTASSLTSDLNIYNGPTLFAINMEDMAVATPSSGGPTHNITIVGEATVPAVLLTDHLKVWVSDDGNNVQNAATTVGVATTITETVSTQTGPNTTVAVTVTVAIPPGTFTTTSEYSNVQVFTVDNYTTVDFYLPFESLGKGAGKTPNGFFGKDWQNYVVLGSALFVDQPVVSVPILGATAASVNFFDNQTDTGGSPPGGPDGLVLGHTNFLATLGTGDIGHTTVFVDATAATTTINDFGHGTFEIGATDATNLNAQSTSHVVMDAPGTLAYIHTGGIPTPTGITVNGSLTGQNLLQGTSGTVFALTPTPTADHGIPGVSGFMGVGSFAGSTTGVGNAVTAGGVGLTLETQNVGGIWQVGNDVLTGGVGGNGVTYTETGGLAGVGITYTGNNGDNYFPEGGNDIVNLAHTVSATTGLASAYSTVWVAFYDVCNSGGPAFILNAPNAPFWGVGQLYGQAVTDIVGGAEVYVDGYGSGTGALLNANGLTGSLTSSLTITGFLVGPDATHGDILNFDVNDWVTGALTNGPGAGAGFAEGLINAEGNSLAALGTHNANAVLFNVGFAGEWTTVGPGFGTPLGTASGATVILDSIGTYANAQQLVKALTTLNVGDITFDGATSFVPAHSVEHILIAYEQTGGTGTNIADVQLINATGAAILSTNAGPGIGNYLNTASTAGLTVMATDMVDLTGVALSQLNPHNIHFV